MRAIYLLSLFCVVTAADEIDNYGKEFCIAVMKIADYKPNKPPGLAANTLAKTIVGTNSSSPVNFTIEYTNGQHNGVTVHHQTVRDSPYVICIGSIANIAVESDSYTDRNKGVCISSVDEQLYVVSYISSSSSSSSSYLALPYQELLADQYEYYTLSTSSSRDEYYSGFLLVGLRNNTSITIYPSIPLNITSDAQNATSVSILVSPGDNHTVILHRQQTLYIGKGDGADVTGTRIVSDKPLTVISGHEAGSVPSDGTLEPMAQQIPPTQLWGERFMIVALEHPHGQIIKILSSVDNTASSYNCHQFSNQTVLLKAGSVEQFFVPASVYCYIETNHSVLVGQFPYSPSGNTDGDTTMILVASTDQYSNEFTFWALNETVHDEMNQYISITVPAEYYMDNSILYDSKPIDSGIQWKPVYNNNAIVGYGCSMPVSVGLHAVSHADSNSKLFVIVYGFKTGRAYGYPAGLQFPPNRVLGVHFSSDEYYIEENEGHVVIIIDRLTHLNHAGTYHFNTINSSDQHSPRYVPVSQDMVFSPMESSLNVPIIINDNGLSEANETFTIQLCYTSSPLTGVCIQSTVTIMDNDILTIGINEMEYDQKNKVLTVSAAILKGHLSPHYSVSVRLNTTLVFTANNYTADAKDFKISSTHFIETINYNNLNGIFKLYPLKSLQRIISELSITNTKVLVTVAPAICELENTTSFAQAACLSPSNSTITSTQQMTTISMTATSMTATSMTATSMTATSMTATSMTATSMTATSMTTTSMTTNSVSTITTNEIIITSHSLPKSNTVKPVIPTGTTTAATTMTLTSSSSPPISSVTKTSPTTSTSPLPVINNHNNNTLYISIGTVVLSCQNSPVQNVDPRSNFGKRNLTREDHF